MGFHLGSMAVFLSEARAEDWPALLGMIVALGTIAGLVGALIAGMIVEPMIQKAKDEIGIKIERIMEAMVSREIFKMYTDRDEAEHIEMKKAIISLSDNRYLR